MIKTMLITNDPAIAADAEHAGVSRLMVDLESHGKKERQASLSSFISTHTPDDVPCIRAAVAKAELVVRVNPIHPGSKEEIAQAIGEGADSVMLPMITSLRQLEEFLSLVKGKARPLPLMETGYSMAHIGDIVAYSEVPELYIGLNDLHLSLGLDLLFEPLALGLIDWMAEKIRAQDKPFGFGGIGALGGSGELPPERILGEHERLGSSCVILSSRFAKDVALSEPEGRRERLTQAVEVLQWRHRELAGRTPRQRKDDAENTSAIIRALADKKRQVRA